MPNACRSSARASLPAGTCHSRRLRSATLPQTPPCSCRRHVAPGKPPLTCFLSLHSAFPLMRIFRIIFAIFSNLRFLVFYHLNHPHIPTPIRPCLRPSSAYIPARTHATIFSPVNSAHSYALYLYFRWLCKHRKACLLIVQLLLRIPWEFRN